MRQVMFLISAAAMAAGMPIAAGQELRGNIASGRDLAEHWCANCHQVSAAARPARAGISSFTEVARLPSTTALSLRVFLRTSHADMPNVQLSEAESDDLIVYILSLKQK